MSDQPDFLSHAIPPRPRRHAVDVPSLVECHREAATRSAMMRHDGGERQQSSAIPDHSRRALLDYRAQAMQPQQG